MAKDKPKRGRSKTANARKKRNVAAKSPSESRKRSVAAKRVEKWQSHSNATKKFLIGIIESTASQILSRSSPEAFEDVQNHLEMLKQRLYARIAATKVPNNTLGDYQKTTVKLNSLKESAVQLEQQQDALMTAISEKKRRYKELVRQLEKVKSLSGTVHPAFAGESEDDSCAPTTEQEHQGT